MGLVGVVQESGDIEARQSRCDGLGAIRGNGSRRDADALPAVKLRKDLRFKGWNDQNYVEGICFWDAQNRMIINFPKKHSETHRPLDHRAGLDEPGNP